MKTWKMVSIALIFAMVFSMVAAPLQSARAQEVTPTAPEAAPVVIPTEQSTAEPTLNHAVLTVEAPESLAPWIWELKEGECMMYIYDYWWPILSGGIYKACLHQTGFYLDTQTTYHWFKTYRLEDQGWVEKYDGGGFLDIYRPQREENWQFARFGWVDEVFIAVSSQDEHKTALEYSLYLPGLWR